MVITRRRRLARATQKLSLGFPAMVDEQGTERVALAQTESMTNATYWGCLVKFKAYERCYIIEGEITKGDLAAVVSTIARSVNRF